MTQNISEPQVVANDPTGNGIIYDNIHLHNTSTKKLFFPSLTIDSIGDEYHVLDITQLSTPSNTSSDINDYISGKKLFVKNTPGVNDWTHLTIPGDKVGITIQPITLAVDSYVGSVYIGDELDYLLGNVFIYGLGKYTAPSRMTFTRVNELPVDLEPSYIYFKKSSGTDFCTHATGNYDVTSRQTLCLPRFTELFNDAVAMSNTIETVPTYADTAYYCDNLTMNKMVLVIDASDDPTVDVGSAMYFLNAETRERIKVYEQESGESPFDFNNIIDITFTALDVDAIVDESHLHTNTSSLDRINTTNEDYLIYNQIIMNGLINIRHQEW